LLATDGRLESMPLKPPTGVLAAARAKGTNRVTWQPRPGVRIATVGVAAADGRVVFAGRNMRAVEARIDDLTRIVSAMWGATIAALFVLVVAIELLGERVVARREDRQRL
jgi:hypothetical protein